MATSAKLTLEEFLALPETEPASELIDGEVVQKPTPTLDHGIIQRLLSFVLTLYLRAHPIGEAGSEIRCIFGPPGGERPYVPDYIFIRAGRFRRGDRHVYGVPDHAVEILSPDDRMTDVMDKLRFYLAHGVRLVWLIDPDRRTVTVMTPPDRTRIVTESETIDGGAVLPEFSCVVGEILPPRDATPGGAHENENAH
jgi:Uma2 family endonuclease